MDSLVMNIKKKHTMGRRKIEIKKIEEKSSRQVTFSKRRTGLFRKASELCILSGVEAAIFVASPKGKVFTFGHPSVDATIGRYMQNNGNNNLEASKNYYQSLGVPFCQISESLKQLRVLEGERDRLKAINNNKHKLMPNDNNVHENWWDRKIEDMGLEELGKFRESLMDLKKKVDLKAMEKNIETKMSAQIEMMDGVDVNNKATVIDAHDEYAFGFHNLGV